MTNHTSEYIEQPQPDPATNSPQIDFLAHGDTLGVVLVALSVFARDYVKRKDSRKDKNEESEEELIDILKQEIEKRDETINRLQNELIITRRTLDYSGEFSPPVSRERVEVVNNGFEPKNG